MVNVSTVRKLSIAARIAAQHAGRTRTVGAIMKGARTTAAHFGRVLRQLWLEVTGFVFLALAFIGAGAFFREYARYQRRPDYPRARRSRNYFHTDFHLVRRQLILESMEKRLRA